VVIFISNETNRYFVKFYNLSDSNLIDAYGGIIRYDYHSVPALMSVEMTELQANELKQHDLIKEITIVSKCSGSAQSMDWGYTSTKVNIQYKGIYTGNGVDVAIIDTGLAYHEDLPTAYEWVDYVDSQSSQYDDHGHGTFCAGIIAGQDNTIGYIGVSPDVNLYIAKVLDSDNMGYLDDFISGIDWAISQNVDIINLSLSLYDDSTAEDKQLLIDACRRAYSAGIVVVSCSGNGTLSATGWDFVANSTVSCPAYDYSCVAVGSVNSSEVRSDFSNYGDGLDIVAPGENVSSTVTGYSFEYGTWSGTSFATAYVTGHLACLKEKYPSYTRSQLVSELLSNVKLMGNPNEYGAGIVMADPLGEFLPDEPKVISRNDKGFTLDWSSIPYTSYYWLLYKKSGGSLYYLKESTLSQYTITNFEYGYAYNLYIEAHNSLGYVITTSNVQIATVNPCPPTLSLVSKTTNSITVQVDLMPGLASGDIVYISPSGDQSSIETSPEGQVTFTGLSPNTQYTLDAKSWILGADGVTVLYSLTNGTSINITTNALAPETPSSAPVITSRGEGSLSLSWGTSQYATSYTLRYKHYDGVYHTIPNISGTTYTLSGLEYGITYFLSVRGDNSAGSSEYTTDNPGTTTAKSPGNLTNPATTNNTIDVRVADGMSGNWDYIRVYAYDNGISPSYKDITYTDYQSGTRIVTWTNLSTGLQYKFNARTYYTYNSVALDSVYWSNDLYVTTISRPSDFSWPTANVVSGVDFNLPFSDWNAFTQRINEFRQYKGLSNYSFTTVSSGGTFYASVFNEARNAIYDMNSIGLPSVKYSGDNVNASDLNGLVSCLNAIE